MTESSGSEAIYRKYEAERAKRIRADGTSQYVRVKEALSQTDLDPYLPTKSRPPKTDHVTFAFVGAGFSGLLTAARLKEAGIDDVRLIDKAGDVGGTWYWNRYPGVQCDTSSVIYLPLLEETGYMPTEKYSHGPEIWEHTRRVAHHYRLYKDALFHTEVRELRWDRVEKVWRIKTNRGDDFTAQFVGIGVGEFHVAKVPRLPGLDQFRGRAFHTSQWDYEYTGGNPSGEAMMGLSDKRVAVIGTGSTAIQVIPQLAKYAQDLYVIQRTPTSVDARNNAAIEPNWFRGISAERGWQRRWMRNFAENWDSFRGGRADGPVVEDLVNDAWTQLGRRMRDAIHQIPEDERTPQRRHEALEAADLEKMENIRQRTARIIDDPKTAESLQAWYPQLCKRPGFHDDYLPSFNRPNVHLIDTDGKGVERVTESGLVVDGQEIDIDCLVFATGFEYHSDLEKRAGFAIFGDQGQTLTDYWSHGMRTLHGLHVHGFPNLFHVQIEQAGYLASNLPNNFSDSAESIALIVSHMSQTGKSTVDATITAEQDWVEALLEEGETFGSVACTPGYFNAEGQLSELDRYKVGYPAGSAAFFALMDEWRESGRFDGLQFDREPTTDDERRRSDLVVATEATGE